MQLGPHRLYHQNVYRWKLMSEFKTKWDSVVLSNSTAIVGVSAKKLGTLLYVIFAEIAFWAMVAEIFYLITNEYKLLQAMENWTLIQPPPLEDQSILGSSTMKHGRFFSKLGRQLSSKALVHTGSCQWTESLSSETGENPVLSSNIKSIRFIVTNNGSGHDVAGLSTKNMKNELEVLIFHVLNLPCLYQVVMTLRYIAPFLLIGQNLVHKTLENC
uniref:Uncharacterized protein n=1 Tax=Cucumis melo TaxID=3656 RepID=A0A9I9EKI5_CUCME